MRDKIENLLKKIEQSRIENSAQAEQFRLEFLSKKGELSNLFADFKNVLNEDKKAIGALINQLKEKSQAKYDSAMESLELNPTKSAPAEDFTKPGFPYSKGGLHPLNITRQTIISIFERIGFTVASGPEIEDDWHNFSALNFPENHPARDMQDTFFINEKFALRTHTSSVQVRLMEKNKPPFRALMPGRVYRNEAISARAHCFFHQVEGLYIDKNVSFADMKQTLLYFSKEMFGEQTKIRLRPSYFPFTEPSAEMDVSCFICNSKGCNVCKYSGWVEIMGCGMVDPAVLQNCGIDSNVYSGFAFGMGIERIAMLKYRVNDLRLFSENDVRFLKQFQAANE
jgi:phenylalanyl-tRNA synthetase alpha chain